MHSADFGSPQHFKNIQKLLNEKDAEIKRLREALEIVAYRPKGWPMTSVGYASAIETARKALRGGK